MKKNKFFKKKNNLSAWMVFVLNDKYRNPEILNCLFKLIVNKNIARISGLLIFIFSQSNAFSQDIIVRTNNDSIRAKVVNITIDKIRYRFNLNKNSPILEIHKNNVKQIIYENGSKLTIVYNRYEIPSEMIIHERAHAIKVELFSPLLNHLTIGYEMKLKLGMNLEIKAGIIGSNISTFLKYSEGFLFKGGIKFIRLSDSYAKGLKYIHPLKGNYFKPEFIFSKYKKDEDHENISYTHYVLDIVFGRQYLLSKTIALDYYGGAGFGIEKSSKDNDFTYAYSHIFFGKGIPLIITGGFTIAFVF